ncbi:MAG TPA: cytochrome C [Blastocatellia bacterium]|nr:cytochrome C [Blastocatellia bacterium]
MNRTTKLAVLITAIVLVTALSTSTTGQNSDSRAKAEKKRVQQGLEIAPVMLDFKNKDRDLVGLGSYIVNAQAACGDCHTCPTYAPGHNPFQGGDGAINTTNYLAGGVPFGPVISANITPDASGKPAGLDFDEYLNLIRTGHDPDDPDEILQVMPWPIFRNMNDRDILAIYTYLTAIPHAEPGNCSGPGQ